jgi:hypothetical protein
MEYSREEVESMDPLSTYFEVRNQISNKQSELIGDIDLKSLLSQMGTGGGGSVSKGPEVEAESADQEPEQVSSNERFFLMLR